MLNIAAAFRFLFPIHRELGGPTLTRLPLFFSSFLFLSFSSFLFFSFFFLLLLLLLVACLRRTDRLFKRGI